jgi:hypothetical protein
VFDPVWSLKGLAQMFSGIALVLLFERDRATKMLYMLRGVLDFTRRRFGRYA